MNQDKTGEIGEFALKIHLASFPFKSLSLIKNPAGIYPIAITAVQDKASSLL